MAEILWRDYDRAALDKQLNLRARTPEHVDFFDRWANESAAVREEFIGYRELAYGALPGETLDYFPALEAQAPLLIFIHGGYWQSLDKSDYSWPAPFFHAQGIAYASLNYTLAPAAPIGQMVQEVQRAVAFLYREAGRLAFDPEKIFVAGHSAGGHLAAEAALTDWAALGDLPRDLLKGAASISGVYDLEPISKSYHQPVVQLDEESVARFSPLRHVAPGAPPLLLAVGGDEPEEFHDQQAEFAALCREKGAEVEELTPPGLHHFSIVDKMTDPDHPLCKALLHMLSR